VVKVLRPHSRRRQTVQSYSPGGANLPSHAGTLAPPGDPFVDVVRYVLRNVEKVIPKHRPTSRPWVDCLQVGLSIRCPVTGICWDQNPTLAGVSALSYECLINMILLLFQHTLSQTPSMQATRNLETVTVRTRGQLKVQLKDTLKVTAEQMTTNSTGKWYSQNTFHCQCREKRDESSVDERCQNNTHQLTSPIAHCHTAAKCNIYHLVNVQPD